MIKTLSLFTGCGGLDLGFEAAGFEVLAAVDIMPESCDTLRLNRPQMKIFGPPDYSGDVADINIEFLEKELGIKKGDIDVIIGGPPCQPFSMAAAQRFLKNDERFKRKGFKTDKGSLVHQYLRIILELKPKVFVIENVPGFITIDNGETINNIKKVLTSYGYIFHGPYLEEVANYGVPQLRKRAIIVGSLIDTPFEMPEKRYNKQADLYSSAYRTVAQALIDLPQDCPNHVSREHKEESRARYKKLKFGQREPLGRVDRLNPFQPSKTIIAGGSSGGGRSHLHPYVARTITPRESARLQTFPDSFKFTGPVGRQFTQIGNAVPPLFAEQIARQIGKIYFNMSYTEPLTHETSYIPVDKANERLIKQAIKEGLENCYEDVNELQFSNSASHLQTDTSSVRAKTLT